jgi:hypothetical protein
MSEQRFLPGFLLSVRHRFRQGRLKRCRVMREFPFHRNMSSEYRYLRMTCKIVSRLGKAGLSTRNGLAKMGEKTTIALGNLHFGPARGIFLLHNTKDMLNRQLLLIVRKTKREE